MSQPLSPPAAFDLAIIGAGASGTLLAAALLRTARTPLQVLLLEQSGRFGRGPAYSTTELQHLLNVPAGKMSALADDPEHFLRWLRTQAPDTRPTDFVPRARYALYLDAVLAEARAKAAPGVQLTQRHAQVRGLQPGAGGVTVQLEEGGSVRAARAVLALGNFPPAALAVPDGGLYASERYVALPWESGGLEAVAPEESVLLLGSGLTAVDVALSLQARGHTGPVHALSRHGLLPQVHRAGVAPHTFAPGALRARALLREVRAEVRRVEAAGGDWRAVVDALRPHTVPLWQRLATADKRRFLRHLRAYWEVHRHRMAPEVGRAIAELLAGGQLRIHAAHVQAFALEADGVRVTLRRRGGPGVQHLHVQRVLNCTGPASPLAQPKGTLVGDLLAGGLARADALRLGLDTREGALVDAQGKPSSVLFALGGVRRPELWESTAIPEIRTQAQALAQHLLAS
ncbi:hydroxyacylglutathione hydrolase [Aggregicoccus sp. 17bor-14]|uniref:FAD/NAD(P)-binding protein n=1 Tax=Myxococcaceae TaxID=31 RepID=UPI00129C720A|nr:MULTISPECIES: FAD/NAD(P)-binding protein [Myxococcaceae]MBF5045814.1 FAD/NAD(P)-binding protein [Simulacricoccus sp. 17bor-14]MRI91549.1 hydroxyacylglutathione hydrolase [Aggregicoccus sp. 17bor-14]